MPNNNEDLKPWQSEQEQDYPTSLPVSASPAQSRFASEQIGPIPIPGAPAGSIQLSPTSYLPPLSPNARMVIGNEIPRSEWLRQPVETQLPWSVLEYERRKKELESQERMDRMIQQLARSPVASASRAIEMATRMEGRLAFDADVNAGMPIPQALMKHATKMYAGSPSSQLAAFKMGQQSQQPAFRPTVENVGGVQFAQTSPGRYRTLPIPEAMGPREAAPLYDKETGRLLGYTVTGSRAVIRPEQQGTLSISTEANIIANQIKQLQSDYEDAVVGPPRAKPEQLQAIKKQIDQKRTEYNDLLQRSRGERGEKIQRTIGEKPIGKLIQTPTGQLK